MAYDAERPDEAKPKIDFGKSSGEDGVAHDEMSFLREALARHDLAWDREESNISDAYDDLKFRAGKQWDPDDEALRREDKRPVLTINMMPQFVRQVTGDMRIMRPSVKVVPVDGRGDKDTAEVLGGMIRYIENINEAQYAYMLGADSQVTCGVGHWRVNHKYADQTTFDQEITVEAVEDGVAVLWDPDDYSPTKEGARYCFVPHDMTKSAFKEQYPDQVPADLTGKHEYEWAVHWVTEDTVRVQEYWEVRPEKKILALNPDGSIDDMTGKDEEEIAAKLAEGAKLEERDGKCVYRSLISLQDVLEGPIKWPGRYIPIIRVVGEEVRTGREVYRHGVVRFAKDPQRAYNYFRSTQTEVIALQPKSPFIGTAKNFEGYESDWKSANRKAHAFLRFKPDSINSGKAPERSSPGVAMQGIEEGLLVSQQEMKATIGIYDAGLGEKSNEKSGKAITARQRESDVGTFVYIDNFARSLRHTGRVIIDLVPHIYDTERVIRVVGVDGKTDLQPINKPRQLQVAPQQPGVPMEDIGALPVPEGQAPQEQASPQAPQPQGPQNQKYNDVTVGAYDVVLETGPSYSTRREEAREGMTELMNRNPELGAMFIDLFAEAQNWPQAEKIAKRALLMMPRQIQEMEAAENGEELPPEPPAPPPPEVQKAMAEVEAEKIRTAAKHEEDMANLMQKFELSMTQMVQQFEASMTQMFLEAQTKREIALAQVDLDSEIAIRGQARDDAVAETEDERKERLARAEQDRAERSTQAEEKRKDASAAAENARRDAAAAAERARARSNGAGSRK